MAATFSVINFFCFLSLLFQFFLFLEQQGRLRGVRGVSTAEALRPRNEPPLLPVCNVVTDCGASPDNSTNIAPLVALCVPKCSSLYFPSNSVFRSGSLDFSHTTNFSLYFGSNTSIYGSTDPLDYPLQPALPPQGPNVTQWMALIYARNISNFAIIGSQNSVIDGLGWPWWANFSAGTLEHQRPKLVELVDAVNVTVANMVTRNSPFWTNHIIYAKGVLYKNVIALAPRPIGNTDGIDPDSCVDVLIEDCFVDVGDDGISLKSGPHDITGELLPTQNVVIRNATILSRNFAIGSACYGGIYDVLVVNTTIGDNNGSSPWAVKFKSHSPNGGVTSNVTFLNCTFGRILPNTYQQPDGGTAMYITEVYGSGLGDMEEAMYVGSTPYLTHNGSPVPLPTKITNITFENIHVTSALVAGQFIGESASPITGLTMKNVFFGEYKSGWSCQYFEPKSTTETDVTPPLPENCGL